MEAAIAGKKLTAMGGSANDQRRGDPSEGHGACFSLMIVADLGPSTRTAITPSGRGSSARTAQPSLNRFHSPLASTSVRSRRPLVASKTSYPQSWSLMTIDPFEGGTYDVPILYDVEGDHAD